MGGPQGAGWRGGQSWVLVAIEQVGVCSPICCPPGDDAAQTGGQTLWLPLNSSQLPKPQWEALLS